MVARVQLRDGTLWQGVHGGHDTDSETLLGALLLTPPFYRRDAGSDETVEYGPADYVVLPLEQMSWLQLKSMASRSWKESDGGSCSITPRGDSALISARGACLVVATARNLPQATTPNSRVTAAPRRRPAERRVPLPGSG